jgi:hypothetical protein
MLTDDGKWKHRLAIVGPEPDRMTDEQIKTLMETMRDTIAGDTVHELCTRLLDAEARVRTLEGLVTELAMDLENEIDARYGQDIHPAMKRRYENDIEVCRRARTALQEQSK